MIFIVMIVKIVFVLILCATLLKVLLLPSNFFCFLFGWILLLGRVFKHLLNLCKFDFKSTLSPKPLVLLEHLD